ncbi:VWA domain-containing protein [bacterium]|nr:VWA domain-containing protein [bacterium]
MPGLKITSPNSSRGMISAIVIGLAMLVGCGDNVQFRNPMAEENPKPKPVAAPKTTTTKPAAKPKPSPEKQARETMIRTTSLRGGGASRFTGGKSVGVNASVEDNVDRLRTEIASSIDFAPTMIVWVVDSTLSANELRGYWANATKQLYTDFQKKGLPGGKPADNLSTALVSFGEKTNVLLDPTTDFSQVIEKIDTIATDNSGKEATFETIGKVLDQFGPIKKDQRRELLVVVVTDETGDDANQVDAVIEKANATGVRIYGIGVPAPMGKAMAEVAPQESRTDGMAPMRQGPETRYSQIPDMKFASGGFGSDDIDSGYGPFGLSYLAYKTRGAFLISRLRSAAWPGTAVRFDEEVMRRYPPQYLSESQYQAKLSENKALASLHQASQLPQIEALVYPATQFTVEDEARLKNALDGAQRIAARLEPLVNGVYDPLNEGEKDRDKIVDKRWQASYDLALGRAAAAKARVDGYNQMLAILKGGRKFEDPSHNTWNLEPADTLEEAGSRLEKVRVQAKEALQRVVKEHPDTPWAYMAEKELEMPIGWKWVEY